MRICSYIAGCILVVLQNLAALVQIWLSFCAENDNKKKNLWRDLWSSTDPLGIIANGLGKNMNTPVVDIT